MGVEKDYKQTPITRRKFFGYVGHQVKDSLEKGFMISALFSTGTISAAAGTYLRARVNDGMVDPNYKRMDGTILSEEQKQTLTTQSTTLKREAASQLDFSIKTGKIAVIFGALRYAAEDTTLPKEYRLDEEEKKLP